MAQFNGAGDRTEQGKDVADAQGASIRRKRRLLVVEPADGEGRLVKALAGQPIEVQAAATREEAARKLQNGQFDVLLVDPVLPDGDGSALIKAATCPALLIADTSSEAGVVRAFDVGAADFICRNAAPAELAVRVWRAMLKGRSDEERSFYLFPNLELDRTQRRCVAFGREVGLTRNETEFLCTLAEARRHFATYRELAGRIWGPGRTVETQNLRVLAGQIRKKIEPDPEQPRLLLTVMRDGYRLAGRDDERG
jgi:two-component system KDP operon response regulator KdpE